MQTYRTWDDFNLINGYVRKTKMGNPYKETTEEYWMLEYVLSLDGKGIKCFNQHTHSNNIVRLYQDNNIIALLDPWYIYSLFPKAIWLAKAAGCIQIENGNKSNTTLQFACFFEAGMINYLEHPDFNHQIDEMVNPERKEALKNVLKVANKFYQDYNIPYITKNKNQITINNIAQDEFEKIESIPVQSWNYPEQNSISLETRGLYHHLGDDLAFLFAASEFGDAYIVGNDEFGEILILGVIPKNGYRAKFKKGDVISSLDIDYLYGVPRANALYPSKMNSIFNYSTEEVGYCKLNNAKNRELTNYWYSDVFKKYAKRDIQAYNFSGFVNYIENKINNVLNKEKYSKQKQSLKDLINTFNTKDNNIRILLDELSIVISGLENKHEIIDHLSTQEQVVKDYDDFLCTIYNHVFSNKLDVKEFQNKILEILRKKTEDYPNLKQLIENTKESLIHVLDVIDSFKTWHDDDFSEDIYNALSFFYKTTAHKVNCEIINPQKNTQLGFFLKDGVADEKHVINTGLITTELLSYWVFTKEPKINFNSFIKQFLLDDLHENMNAGDSYKEMLKYWSELDNDAFVISEVVDMQNEYRIFVVNHRPVSGSPCFRNSTPFDAYDTGRFNPRLCVGHSAYETFENEESRARVAKYAKFAREFCAEMKKEKPDCGSYVLDVAWSDTINDVLAIEINTVSWSGAYQTDMRKVCAAVAKVPYHYSNMKNLGRFKEKILEVSPITLVENVVKDDLFEDQMIDNEIENSVLHDVGVYKTEENDLQESITIVKKLL